MPCPVMRGGLWLIMEGSEEFEVVGRAGDGEEVVWTSGDTDCFGDSRRVRTAAGQLRRKLGDDADKPTYIFTETHVGYHMAEAET